MPASAFRHAHVGLAALVISALGGCASLRNLNASHDVREYRTLHSEAERRAQAGDLDGVAEIARDAPPKPREEKKSIYDVYVRATGAALRSVACEALQELGRKHDQPAADVANADVLVGRIRECNAQSLLLDPIISDGLRKAGKFEAARASSPEAFERSVLAALASEQASLQTNATAEAIVKALPPPIPDSVCRAVAGALDKFDPQHPDRFHPAPKLVFLRSLREADCPERAAAAASLLADLDSSIRAEACTVLGGSGEERYADSVSRIAMNDPVSVEEGRIRTFPVRDACQRALTRLRLPR